MRKVFLPLFFLAASVAAQPGHGPISGGGGGVTGLTSCADGTALADNALLRADGTNKCQGSTVTISDVSGVTTTLATITPAATTGATVAGQSLAITASPAVASTDTAGAAAGGSVTITAGAAARNTSGNANGGNVNLITGAGIGTGTAGQVVVPLGVVTAPGISFFGDPNTGIFSTADEIKFSMGGVSPMGLAGTVVNIQNGALLYGNTSGLIRGFLNVVTARTGTVGSPFSLTDHFSWATETNEGAAAKSYITLPTAVSGSKHLFCTQDADGLRVTANTSDTIRVIDKVTAAAGYIESTTIGACVELLAINAVEWFTTSIHGIWTDGTFTYDDTSLTTP